jgi:valyl-tRNA synthetase
MKAYKLFWDEFSAWYLEAVKPEYQKPIDAKTYKATVKIFEKLMHVLHPFMPFITEEIWHLLEERKEGESIMVSMMPEHKKFSKTLVSKFETAKEIISAIRTVRKDKEIATKDKLELHVRSGKDYDGHFLPVIMKLCNLSDISFTNKKLDGAASFIIDTVEYYIPLGGLLDVESELLKASDELLYTKGFLKSVMAKLENERFVQNAPANVIDMERKKKADAESHIRSLEERIRELESL